MADQKRLVLTGIVVALAGFVFQTILQNAMRVHARQGIYFQGWSSETLTQTVPIQDLREAPVETVLNIHIAPPAFDIVRAVFVAWSPSKEIHEALRDVDVRITVLWTILYSLAGALVFYWTAQLTRVMTGIVLAAIFLLHPGSIFYTTLLDPTILTTFLILCMYHLLWRIKGGSSGAIAALGAVVVALFLTKSIFQMPVILLIGFCLYLFRVPRRPLLIFLLTTSAVTLLYTAKQFYMFRILGTSSFAGYNLCKSIGIDNNYTVSLDLEGRDETGLAGVLRRQAKLTGAINYNNINYLDFSNYLIRKYVKYVLKFPMASLVDNYRHNLELYWRPSSRFGNEVNVIVKRLPYRAPFDAVFSYPVFPATLLAAGVYALWRSIRQGDLAGFAGMLLPGLAIFVITVIGDKGENMRYKYFLEPVFMIFIVWALHDAFRRLSRRTVKAQ